MTIQDIVRRSSRSIFSAKVRTLLTAFAIAVGTFSLTLTLAASNGAENFIDQIISENFDPTELIVANDERILGNDGSSNQPIPYDSGFTDTSSAAGARIQIRTLDEQDIEAIRAVDNVERVRKDITVNALYATRDGSDKYIATIAAFNEFQQPTVLAGTIDTPLENRELLLPEAWLDSLDFNTPESAIGEEITIALRESPFINASAQTESIPSDPTERTNEANITEETYRIAAVLAQPTTAQPGTELYMYVSEDEAMRLEKITREGSDAFGTYSIVFAKIQGGEDAAALEAAQEEIRAMGYTAQSVQETQDFLNQIIAVLQGIVAAFGVIAIIASVFGIINTMYISVIQRTREIGLMKALGMSSRDVGRLFRFEAAWIGFLGGAIGSIGAVTLGLLINPWVSEQLQLGEDTYLLLFNIWQIIGLILILIVVSILAGWLPSRKAAKLDPIAALRTE